MSDSKHLRGYSLAVGGVVLHDRRVLLVRRASGGRAGEWQIPGGFVEPHESIHAAVQREIWEETGVRTEVHGLVAVLNRALAHENNTYFVFLLEGQTDDVRVDGHEIDEARFFTLRELRRLQGLQSLSRLVATSALQGRATIWPYYPHARIPATKQVLFAGEKVRPEYRRLVHALWYESFRAESKGSG